MAGHATRGVEADHGIHGAWFTVDSGLKVVCWSAEAERTSGIPLEEALGRRCWEVSTAEPGARRPTECRGCLPVGEQAGSGGRLDCVPLPLPGRPDRALVWLARDGRTVPLLLLGGALGSILAGDVSSTGLERAIELVRRACRADDAELFLEEPSGGDLVLAAHNGRDRSAFFSRDRFAPGRGYPGAMVASGRSLVARDPSVDTALLRREISAAGVRRYDGVPVLGPAGIVGALGLAWRRPERAPPETEAQLVEAARLIGVAVAARKEPKPAREPSVRAGDAPPLDLRCFGAFEVRMGGRLVPGDAFSRRKALSLLKLLVLRAGNPVPRDELCELLWPEADGERSLRNRLHVTVHALRSAIEPEQADRRWIFVRNEGELYHFNMDVPHRIDLYELKRLSSLASRARSAGRLEETLSLGEKAASLYRGPLFAEEPYADWCLLERESAERGFIDLVRMLAGASGELGDNDRAVQWLRRALAVAPLEEDLHRSLIELLAALGRPAEALEQYRTCERALRDQLGAEPMPETRRLGRLLIDRRARVSAT